MMKTNDDILGCFGHDRKGMAATEFALLAPVMFLLFFGAIEGRTAHYTGDRVIQAASILADISAKESEITESEIDDLMIGVEGIIEPLEAVNLTMILVSVVTDDAGSPIVAWSRSNKIDDREPYTKDSSYTNLRDNNVLKPGFSLLVAEVEYEHDSGLTGHILKKTLKYKSQKIRMPRRSNVVALVEDVDDDG